MILEKGDVVIRLDNTSKSFGKKKIIDNISLTIKKGEAFGIFGPSGSGKSVLLKIAMGFLNPSSGKVTISHDSKIGFSAQNNAIYDNLTVRENLIYFASLYNVKFDKQKFDRLLSVLDIKQYERTLVSKLSGGTKKRVDIACALINDPDILVLDEPLNGLDHLLIRKVLDFLLELNKNGMTIILSSHITDRMEELCERGAFVDGTQVYVMDMNKLKTIYG